MQDLPTLLFGASLCAAGATSIIHRPAAQLRRVLPLVLVFVIPTLYFALVGKAQALPLAPLLTLAIFDALYHQVPRIAVIALAMLSIATALLWWAHKPSVELIGWASFVAITLLGLALLRRQLPLADRIAIASLAVAFGPAAALAFFIAPFVTRGDRVPVITALAPGALLSAFIMDWLW